MSNPARLCCTALLLIAANPAGARNDAVRTCLDRPSGGEQKQCTEALYRAASAELEAVYHGVVDRASKLDKESVPSQAAAIAKSQKAWEAYRDAECRGVVGYSGGSGTPVWFFGCLAEKTFERIQELKVPFNQR